MVEIVGKVSFVSPVKQIGDKELIQFSIMQGDGSQRPVLYNLDVWSDNRNFDEFCCISNDENVRIYANVACERKNGIYTGNLRYYPNKIEVV